MSLKKLITNQAEYNLWANETLINWLKTKPQSAWTKEVPSSFSSITKTIVHIWDTERFWYSVFKVLPPPISFRFTNYDGTGENAMDELLKQSKAILAFVLSLSEEDFLKDSYLDTPWVKGTLPLYEFIQHTFTHSTYHRGQMITIGRNAELTDAPMTDYNFYNMMVRDRKEVKKAA